MPTSNPMSDPYATSVPRLEPTGSNWAIFSMRFQEAMEANQKWGHFDGSATRPAPADDKNPTADETKAASEWDQNEVVARYLLSQRLPDSTAVCLKGLASAKERTFSEMRCPRGGDVRSFLGSMHVKREELAAVGVTMALLESYPPPLPLTPTSSLTIFRKRLIGSQLGASAILARPGRASSPSPKARMRRWQPRKATEGGGGRRESATIVASKAIGPAIAGRRRRTSSQNSTKAENKPVGSANAVDDEPDGCWSAVFVGDVLESGAQATTPLECEEAGAGTAPSGGLAAAAITQVEEVKPARVELYDSGATRHISPYRDDFVNYRALEPPLFLHAANGQRFPAIGTSRKSCMPRPSGTRWCHSGLLTPSVSTSQLAVVTSRSRPAGENASHSLGAPNAAFIECHMKLRRATLRAPASLSPTD